MASGLTTVPAAVIALLMAVTRLSMVVTPEESWRARAAAAAEVGAEMARLGHYADPDRLTPIYIRKPEAEEKWDALHGAGGPPGG